MFVEFDESKSGHVTLRDTFKIPLKGKDKILIHL